MRITTLTLLSILAFTLMVSCKKKTKKEDTTYINYPGTAYFGTNILALPDGGLGSGTYGMGAELGKDAQLKIVITNLSTQTNTNLPQPFWGYQNNIGWVISPYNTTQTFTSSQIDKVDAELVFIQGGGQGSCKIDIYENSNSITKTKYFHW
jgi:hypothetical protein